MEVDNLVPQVVLAAAQAVGERYEDETADEYSTRLLEQALGLMAMMSKDSWVGSALLAMQNVNGVFAGEVVEIKYLETSKRYELAIKAAKPSKFSSDGLDRIKTQRIDGKYRIMVKNMLQGVKVGSYVRIWKQLESSSNTTDGKPHSSILYMEKLR